MERSDCQKLVDELVEPVIAAGRTILDVRSQGFDVERKDDSSLVTEADVAAEEILLRAVRDCAPDIPVIAEEMSAEEGLPDHVGRRFWLIDPLDGTREFVNGGADFTVNVALIEAGRPRLGLVYAPAGGRLYAGIVGNGGWSAEVDGDRVGARGRTSVRQANPDALDVVASKSHRDEKTDAFLKTVKVGDLKAAGSSLKFCLLARGEADLYPRFGPTMEWDTAAGQAVLEAAVGRVSTPEGAPFLYNKPGFKNGPFIAVGDPSLPY